MIKNRPLGLAHTLSPNRSDHLSSLDRITYPQRSFKHVIIFGIDISRAIGTVPYSDVITGTLTDINEHNHSIRGSHDFVIEIVIPAYGHSIRS